MHSEVVSKVLLHRISGKCCREPAQELNFAMNEAQKEIRRQWELCGVEISDGA